MRCRALIRRAVQTGPFSGSPRTAIYATNGRAVATELVGDGGDRQRGVQQAENRAALVEIELLISHIYT